MLCKRAQGHEHLFSFDVRKDGVQVTWEYVDLLVTVPLRHCAVQKGLRA